ncbi:MAG: tRNA (adenosine(37)-N6)-threonylcarbamoyltransferase complex dimerization subunit type 1 TsaB [Candidatus Accumulibacter sp.]|jgi:tRNA threonylcarbamoyladenosine biosynthesis protein TsaB|nr:tRNA (adenosine(37)-N6)-threonylcarbamoyltransferase complex dimerization subunit type 1 TsaB [Accumulibacter sp.]
MKVLAIETAADPATLALWVGGALFVRRSLEGHSNSSTLLPMLSDCLRDAEIGLDDLDGIAFGQGPGSFTGLRVACGLALGLSAARATPLLGVGTLDAMACLTRSKRVLALLDARMGEVYAGFFVDGVRHGEIGVYSPENLPLPSQGGWLACGNGLNIPGVRERLAPFVDAWRPEIAPHAEGIARLAVARFAAGERADHPEASLLYVRDKVAKTLAEREAEGRNS